MQLKIMFTDLRHWMREEPWAAFYRIGGAAFGIAGILVIFRFPQSNAQHATPAGIAVFAVLYVIAQAVERLVEWVTDFLKLFPDTPGAQKAALTRQLRTANSTINGNPTLADFAAEEGVDAGSKIEALKLAADKAVKAATEAKEKKEAEVDDKRTDVLFLTHGLSILLAAIAVNWMNYGIMDSLGVTGLNDNLNRLLTALAAAGGSKALHELIGRVQVAKENAQTSP